MDEQFKIFLEENNVDISKDAESGLGESLEKLAEDLARAFYEMRKVSESEELSAGALVSLTEGRLSLKPRPGEAPFVGVPLWFVEEMHEFLVELMKEDVDGEAIYAALAAIDDLLAAGEIDDATHFKLSAIKKIYDLLLADEDDGGPGLEP